MVDIVKASVRSQMMSGIRGKNTGPELVVRRYLHAVGLRFRLHQRRLPGCPDLVLSKWNCVVFVHGCFWHGHEGCRYFRVPTTRVEFWLGKIKGNAERDVRAVRDLRQLGWRVFVIWECALRSNQKGALCELVRHIRSDAIFAEIVSKSDQLAAREE